MDLAANYIERGRTSWPATSPILPAKWSPLRHLT